MTIIAAHANTRTPGATNTSAARDSSSLPLRKYQLLQEAIQLRAVPVFQKGQRVFKHLMNRIHCLQMGTKQADPSPKQRESLTFTHR